MEWGTVPKTPTRPRTGLVSPTRALGLYTVALLRQRNSTLMGKAHGGGPCFKGSSKGQVTGLMVPWHDIRPSGTQAEPGSFPAIFSRGSFFINRSWFGLSR